MKSFALTASAILESLAALAAPTVTITGTPVQDASTREITVNYNLSEPAIVTLDVLTNGVSIGAGNVKSVWGDVNKKLAAGSHTLTWQPLDDWPVNLATDNCQISVVPWSLENPPPYMVVMLGMASNVNFYAAADAVPWGVVSDFSRRYQMVFSRIPATGVRWQMGQSTPVDSADKEVAHYVTLTNDYYMGVFPVTFEQRNMMAMATGSQISTTGPRPDNTTSYEQLRGATSGHDWPSDGHAVASDSLIGQFRRQSGLDGIDLPTEAEWEFACRAGTTTRYYFGDDASVFTDYGWCLESDFTTHGGTLYPSAKYVDGNSKSMQMQIPGLLLPNAYGLYDMHGNVWEWCLDWYSDGYAVAGSDVTAPTGPNSSPVGQRVIRGGSFAHHAEHASSGYHGANGATPDLFYYTIGVRLCCPADMRTAEDGAGTGGAPVAAVASVTGFAPAAKSETAVAGLGTAQCPLDFLTLFDIAKDGLDFDSRKPKGMVLIFR
jgi:formylglycine-generating enzyme required for sulfatase activity